MGNDFYRSKDHTNSIKVLQTVNHCVTFTIEYLGNR